MSTLTPVEILTKAQEFLRERGLTKSGWFVGPPADRPAGPPTCLCALGAVKAAMGKDPNSTNLLMPEMDAYMKITRALDDEVAELDVPTNSVTLYNDRPDTTLDDVIRVLEGAKARVA